MNNRTFKTWHRKLAPIVFLPLFVTAFTGMGYRLGKSWFGLSDNFGEWMMYIHQGSYLGSQLRSFYVFLNGLGLVGMVVSGIVMSGIFRGRRTTSPNDSPTEES
ncbi:hypothetical protein [Baaleninema sp.]|uniref:hypothetical protein n=1 Tax=Baaleninema sp. TaxID=3101197 RepID=UPI003D02FD1A